MRAWAAIWLVVLLGIGGGLSRAHAQDNEAAAEGLFQDGVRLREAGKWKRACEKFHASQKLAPARGTLLNIAECYERFGELARAWASYRRLALESEAANDSERLRIARARIQVLEPMLPRVVIRLSPEAAIDGIELRLDGAPVDATLHGVGVPVDSGEHTVTATAPGRFGWTTRVTVAPGSSATVLVPELHSVAARARRVRRRKLIAGTFLGAGAGALAASGVFGLRARGQWRDAQPFCNADDACSADGLALIDDARSSARLANIFGAVGLTACAAGAVIWLTKPSLRDSEAPSATSVAPAIGHRSAGVVVTRQF